MQHREETPTDSRAGPGSIRAGLQFYLWIRIPPLLVHSQGTEKQSLFQGLGAHLLVVEIMRRKQWTFRASEMLVGNKMEKGN